MDEEDRAVIAPDYVGVSEEDRVIDLTGDDSDTSGDEDLAPDNSSEDGSSSRSQVSGQEQLYETEDERSETEESSNAESQLPERQEQLSETNEHLSEVKGNSSEAKEKTYETEKPGACDMVQEPTGDVMRTMSEIYMEQEVALDLSSDFISMQCPIEVLHRPESRVQKNECCWDWDFDERATRGPWSPTFLPVHLRPIAYVTPTIRAPAPDAPFNPMQE